ncbi:MAG: hypothetical protein M1569_00735 [Candidatus Marsarchaeota archaeon]|nr:hypothetical protein [Candidatus Marsarchaeota archaeon]MCL5412914.1 hypothetical protein [Candidatus Marsarchaeota archaeon]
MKCGISGYGYALPRFSKKLFAFKSSSGADISEIIDCASRLSEGANFIVILDDIKNIDKLLIPAYLNAIIRRNDGSMHAESLSIEIMLFIAGTMNIGNAMKLASATSSKRFVIFSDSMALIRRILSGFDITARKIGLSVDLSKSSAVAVTAIRDEK